jgi:GDPmannose 4,6-dehydratase
MKKALITGITGQDGHYLTKLLLDEGYEVHGLIRKASTFNTERIDEFYNNPDIGYKRLHLHFGDMTDSSNLNRVLNKIKPDEIYNLAAQSHVKVSFDMPEYTGDVDALGVIRLLDAIRDTGINTRFYQASTSELFGGLPETAPQNEDTPFTPRSPYAAAKLYGYWIVRNYREAYNMFACNGILFNHESILKNSPIILKDKNNKINILPIEDIFKAHKYEGVLEDYKNYFIWNGDNWTKIINGTRYKDDEKKVKAIQTRQACYEATYEHIAFNEQNDEVKTIDLKIGDKLFKTLLPNINGHLSVDESLAYFIGFVVGDGYISEDGRIRITGCDKVELENVANLIINMYGWTYNLYTCGAGQFENCVRDVWQLEINNDRDFGKWLRNNIYTKYSSEKKVPQFILISDFKVKKAFIDGYYLADGRKAGHEQYQYKGFTTKSATLCLGLILLFNEIGVVDAKCKMEYRDNRRYYYVQFRNQNKNNNRGSHLLKDLNQIIKVYDTNSEDGWFYDIQTESQTFATGVNLVKVHNSPMRLPTFVTRKITQAVSRIYYGKQNILSLGNLNAIRDWSFAGDMVRGMHLMLQQDKPDDFVLASGEGHTVKQFVENAFNYIGIDVVWDGEGINEVGINPLTKKVMVKIEERFFRPTEVDYLLGDASKAKKQLGWQPEVSFQELIAMMMNADLELIRRT